MQEINRTPDPWSDAEIATWVRRKNTLELFTYTELEAEDLAERMLYRDRDTTDDRRICLECAYLLNDVRQSRHVCQNRYASVVRTFEPCKTVLWRCDYFWMKGKK